MIELHFDRDKGKWWAEVTDLHLGRPVGVTFLKRDKAAVLQEARAIEARYEQTKKAT